MLRALWPTCRTLAKRILGAVLWEAVTVLFFGGILAACYGVQLPSLFIITFGKSEWHIS